MHYYVSFASLSQNLFLFIFLNSHEAASLESERNLQLMYLQSLKICSSIEYIKTGKKTN